MFAFMVSCNSGETGGLSETAQKNLDAMHGIAKCFDTKDFSNIGDFIAADAVDHAGQTGDVVGLENMKAEFEKWSAGNEDAKSEVIKELADDEYVMSWMRFTGKVSKDTPEMGMKAGDSYDMKAIELIRCKDGKIVEHWTFMTPDEMMKMMGNMSQGMPDAPMPEDTP